ncbi:DUF982 domain-containing protein [Pararhizobium sp. PWRC1-1]|uniref:DUF982 domain-containing protein n=1 Tax=Pararhizobium sp. PWRC1-1 TaxID=2804566 RepID=UPI003CEC3323
MLVIKPENCSDVSWNEPVLVQLRFGFPEKIETPLQALNCLAQRWPKVGGEQYERARHLCMAALGGRVQCDTVRVAFVAAAEEADVLAHETRKPAPTFGNIEPG